MIWFRDILAYIVIWWIIFFMTLPFGIKTLSKEENINKSGVPEKPRIFIKSFITTLLAFFIWIIWKVWLNKYLYNLSI
ncbi:MAG: DUF1467 family protein [Alphaproteobacteria bacterium]|nr:DUF1467 family protein [Alphaproteobacteria bacterium]